MGTATLEGRLWGARANDWAVVQEWEGRPAYQFALDEFGPWLGVTVLDIGCGSGGFARMAAASGARIAGIDAAPELIEIAECRVPGGAFRVCDMEDLPYAEGSFTMVTALNSLQHAGEPLHAVAEAARVTTPGGRVLAMVWGTPGECDATSYVQAIEERRPPTPGSPGPFALSAPSALEKLFIQAGLTVTDRRDVECPWFYSDETAALRGLLSTGPAVSAINHSGEAAVSAAVLEAIGPFRCRSGVFLLRNKFHCVVGTR
ncbi:MAG TPA: class I SAM-dependent methyltransferase [Pilimelia sp.]|nr:class I SAM-dependent methyltransferase [Pilimelia sp.]